MSGEIRDFSKPNPHPERERGEVRILKGQQTGVDIQRLSALTGVEQPTGAVEYRVHEEVITQDDKLRGKKPQPGEPEVRVRQTDRAAWEKVKMDEDE